MGQVLHGSARTTETVRRAIQHKSREPEGSGEALRHQPEDVCKWKGRDSVADLRTGPKEPRSTVLSVEEEAVVVAFRRHTLLPLDNYLYALHDPAPDTLIASLLPSAAWDQPAARG